MREGNNFKNKKSYNVAKLEPNSLRLVVGGEADVSQDENKNIKLAKYFCDKCGELVLIQKDGEFEKKKIFTAKFQNGFSTYLCNDCRNKK